MIESTIILENILHSLHYLLYSFNVILKELYPSKANEVIMV